MSLRSILSTTERGGLVASDNMDELIHHFTFSDVNLAMIWQSLCLGLPKKTELKVR